MMHREREYLRRNRGFTVNRPRDDFSNYAGARFVHDAPVGVFHSGGLLCNRLQNCGLSPFKG